MCGGGGYVAGNTKRSGDWDWEGRIRVHLKIEWQQFSQPTKEMTNTRPRGLRIWYTEGNQSKSWEKVWENWNCLSLVTSHVVGTSRVQHTTSYMSYKQMKTLSLFTTRQPIKILKKSVTSVFFCHWSLLMLLAPVEQSIKLLIGAQQQLLLYHTTIN